MHILTAHPLLWQMSAPVSKYPLMHLQELEFKVLICVEVLQVRQNVASPMQVKHVGWHTKSSEFKQ
jgi:hypothetical protein